MDTVCDVCSSWARGLPRSTKKLEEDELQEKEEHTQKANKTAEASNEESRNREKKM